MLSAKGMFERALTTSSKRDLQVDVEYTIRDLKDTMKGILRLRTEN